MLSTNGSISDENVSARRIPTDYKATREISHCKYLSQESIHVIYFLKCSLGFVHVHRCKRYPTSPNLQPPSTTGICVQTLHIAATGVFVMTRKLWVLQRIAALWWCSVCRHTLRCRSNNNDNSLFGLDKLSGNVFVLPHLVESYCVLGF